MPLQIQIKPRQHLSSIEDILTFGKMKDQSVKDICHDEPSYLMWLMDKGAVSISDDLQWIILEAIDNHAEDKKDIGFLDEIPY